ncbi:hypothetical protein [Thermosulfuriphilus sp.]
MAGVALFLIISSCAPRSNQAIQPRLKVLKGWALFEAKYSSKNFKEAQAILEDLLNKEDYRCRAAFYLFVLKGKNRDRYLDILRSTSCRQRLPAENILLDRYLRLQKEAQSCHQSLKNSQKANSSLKKRNIALEERIKQLRFELEKLEEIRRDTERRRLKEGSPP